MENSLKKQNIIFNTIFNIFAICLIVFSSMTTTVIAFGAFDDLIFIIPSLFLFFILYKYFTYLYSKNLKEKGFVKVVLIAVFLGAVFFAVMYTLYIYSLFEYDLLYNDPFFLKAIFAAFLASTNKQLEFVNIKHTIIKVTCLVSLIFIPLIVNLLLGRFVMDKISSTLKKRFYESVSIITVDDQYLYSIKDNQVGLYMKYTITPNENVENYSDIDLKSPRGFKLSTDSNKPSIEQPSLIIFNAQIHPTPVDQTLLKGQVYTVTLYAIPMYIQDKNKGYMEVENLRIFDGRVINLDSMCINKKKTDEMVNKSEAGFYSTEFRIWHPVTKNSYNPLNLYHGYLSENIPFCLNTEM